MTELQNDHHKYEAVSKRWHRFRNKLGTNTISTLPHTSSKPNTPIMASNSPYDIVDKLCNAIQQNGGGGYQILHDVLPNLHMYGENPDEYTSRVTCLLKSKDPPLYKQEWEMQVSVQNEIKQLKGCIKKVEKKGGVDQLMDDKEKMKAEKAEQRNELQKNILSTENQIRTLQTELRMQTIHFIILMKK